MLDVERSVLVSIPLPPIPPPLSYPPNDNVPPPLRHHPPLRRPLPHRQRQSPTLGPRRTPLRPGLPPDARHRRLGRPPAPRRTPPKKSPPHLLAPGHHHEIGLLHRPLVNLLPAIPHPALRLHPTSPLP